MPLWTGSARFLRQRRNHAIVPHFSRLSIRDAIRAAGFNVVVDYAFASTSQVLPDILQILGVNTTPLGARVDPSYISLDEEVFLAERRRLGVIVNALGSDLGAARRGRGRRCSWPTIPAGWCRRLSVAPRWWNLLCALGRAAPWQFRSTSRRCWNRLPSGMAAG